MPPPFGHITAQKEFKKKTLWKTTLALFKFPAKQPFRMAKCGRVVCVCVVVVEELTPLPRLLEH